MRQLRIEGWMHHVSRHAVACFLTRGDLWISWEEGLKVMSCTLFFLQHSVRISEPVLFLNSVLGVWQILIGWGLVSVRRKLDVGSQVRPLKIACSAPTVSHPLCTVWGWIQPENILGKVQFYFLCTDAWLGIRDTYIVTARTYFADATYPNWSQCRSSFCFNRGRRLARCRRLPSASSDRTIQTHGGSSHSVRRLQA